MTENGVLYAGVVFGIVGLMLAGVIFAVVKMLNREGSRPGDDHL
jgi:predicted PurR-regulated permease PerM